MLTGGREDEAVAVDGRGVRSGLDQSAWTELNVSRLSDAAFLGMFRNFIDRALARYNQDVQLAIPIPNSPLTSDLTLKRYRPGEQERGDELAGGRGVDHHLAAQLLLESSRLLLAARCLDLAADLIARDEAPKSIERGGRKLEIVVRFPPKP